MKNTTAVAIATAITLTAVPAMLWYYQLPDGQAPTPEPENSEPIPTEAEKQGLLKAGAVGMFKDINQAASYGLISQPQVDDIKAATRAIVTAIKPEDLVQDLVKAKGIVPQDFAQYNPMKPTFIPYGIKNAFTAYLSPQLKDFNAAVGGYNGCFTKFDHPDAGDGAANRVRSSIPDGVSEMHCENATEVNIIGYPADGKDVEVSYNFGREVAYFEKTGYYARQNCDDENDCFSTESFAELENSAGLARAFDDKAQAEASLAEVKAQAQAYIAEKWPQIEAEMADAIKPAAPAPR